MSTNNLKPCQLCDFIAPSLKYLLKHLRQVHSHQPGFQITCRLSGCQRVFRTFDVYRNHVYAIHKEQESIVPEVSGPPADDHDDQEYLDDHNPGHADFDDSSNVSTHDRRKRAAATWILKVQELYKLPQSTMGLILKDFTGFIEDLLTDLCDDVTSTLSDAGIDHVNIPRLHELFGDQSPRGWKASIHS